MPSSASPSVVMAVEQERLTVAATAPRWVIEEHRARYRFAAQFVKDRLVVDCACGDGIGTLEFTIRGPARIIAVDASVEAVRCAKAATSGVLSPSAAVFLRADAAALPLASQVADVFISLETLEHVGDADRFLDEARRIVRAKGIFVCSTPNRAVTHPGAPLAIRPMNRFHEREYRMDEFRERLAARFHDVSLYGQNPQSLVHARMFRMLARLLPYRVSAQINQLLKVRRVLWYDSSCSQVVPLDRGFDYEYVVAVCRRPIQQSS